jgi:uncharacterized protein YkwD
MKLRRLIFALLALLILAVVLRPEASVPSSGQAPAMTAGSAEGLAKQEQRLFADANRERAFEQLAALKWDAALAKAARQHAQRMAREYAQVCQPLPEMGLGCAISHQFPGEPDLRARALEAGARFKELAENVGEGPTVDNIHSAWMHSTGHRANLLAKTLDSMGIGVVEVGGEYFAVEDFSLAIPRLTLEEQEQRLGALLEARGLQLLSAAADARRVCVAGNAFAAPAHVSLEMSFSTDDLSRLPTELEQQIHQGQYHSAAVGACLGSEQTRSGFYRLAVLLY